MNNRVLLFLFLIIVTHINATTKHLFIVEKDFLEAEKIIQNYLSKKVYTIKERDDKIVEIYFDVPELLYLKQNGYVRYKAVAYLSKKKKRVKYKESIDYSLDNHSSYTFSVKHYKNIKTFEEKHPLLGLVKRKERQDFLDKLHNSGIKYPTRLKEIVRVSKLTHTFEINNSLETIHISKIEASAFDTKTGFILLETDVNNQRLIDELINILHIKDQKAIDNEYLIAFKEMEKNVGLFYWILKYPYLVNLLYAAGFGLFGLLIIYILFGRRLKGD